MRLIDEIESAAMSCSIIDDDEDALLAHALVASPYWPRIRVQLLLAEEMAQHAQSMADEVGLPPAVADWHARFRAAAGEGS